MSIQPHSNARRVASWDGGGFEGLTEIWLNSTTWVHPDDPRPCRHARFVGHQHNQKTKHCNETAYDFYLTPRSVFVAASGGMESTCLDCLLEHVERLN